MTDMFLDIPELSGKQVELLKEIVPRLSRIAIFGIPSHGPSRSKLKLWKCPRAAAPLPGAV
jgi:hypothetical protein